MFSGSFSSFSMRFRSYLSLAVALPNDSGEANEQDSLAKQGVYGDSISTRPSS